VTLDLWVTEEDSGSSYLATLIERFQAATPGITVKTTKYPEDGFGVKLTTAIAAGQAPDMALVYGPDDIRTYELIPIDDALADAGIDLSTFSQAIMGDGGEFSCGWEGNVYCVGSYQGIYATVYNKSLLDAKSVSYPPVSPPQTPEQFVDAACKLSDPANNVWGAAAADPMSFLPWETYVSDDGRTAIGHANGPDTVKAFEVLAKGVADGCIPTLNVFDPSIQGRDYLARGEVAMVITDVLDLTLLEESGIDYGVGQNPTPAGIPPYFFSWSDTFGILPGSDNPDEAKQFLVYVATEGQRIRAEATGDLPLDSKAAEEVNWAQGIAGREELLELSKTARPALWIPNRWDVFAPLWDAWGLVTGGEKTAQQALDDVAPLIQENLDAAWEEFDAN
jgi:multiple sugar transport system substrate-binding protein